MFEALVFLGGQLGVGLLILLQLNGISVLLGASAMGIVVTYPLMKRFTYYPQFVLGLAFNWGAILGWSSVHGDLSLSVCLPLYIAGISWTMIYDTIYAHQDKYDDVIIGIKSTAIKFGSQTPVCLGCFGTLMVSCLSYTGWLCGQTLPFYTSIAAIAAHLAHQVYTLDIDNREDCAKKFQSNRWVGLLLFLGIVSGTYMKEQDEPVILDEVSVENITRIVSQQAQGGQVPVIAAINRLES
jgi:4-hydroxybenzoate polyprenyltransferase